MFRVSLKRYQKQNLIQFETVRIPSPFAVSFLPTTEFDVEHVSVITKHQNNRRREKKYLVAYFYFLQSFSIVGIAKMTNMVVEDLEQIISDTKTKLYNKRCYIIIAATGLFLVMLCVGLLAAIIAIRSHGCFGNNREEAVALAKTSLMKSLCGDKSCLRSSAYLTDNMDTSVSPCDDFYQYSCGGWMSRHDIPPTRTKVTVFDEMKDENDERTREVRVQLLLLKNITA